MKAQERLRLTAVTGRRVEGFPDWPSSSFFRSLEDGESAEGTVSGDNLHVDTVGKDLALLLQLSVLDLGELGEAVLDGSSDLLAAGELEHGSSQGLLGVLDVLGAGSDRHEDVADVDASGTAVGLAVGLSHTLLESIGTSAGEHLVDSENVPRVHSDSHVESVLTCLDLHVLVGSDTGGLQSLRSDLLLLAGDEVNAVGELVVGSLLSADVVDSELRVGHTTVVAGLGVGLVLLVSIAARRSSSHFVIK